MRFIYVLIVAAVLLSITINFSTDLNNGGDVVSRATSKYNVDVLKAKHGHQRNFNHTETRSLYRSLLKEVELTIQGLQDGFSENERAVVCSVMRANVRKYTRQRDTLGISEFVLQMRDSYVHAVRYLPLALRKDMKEALTTGRPTIHRTAITLKQAFVCLAPHLTDGECPSYTFLTVVRGKTDKDILKSCLLSNKGYDKVYGG